jgi:hypothetical protein
VKRLVAGLIVSWWAIVLLLAVPERLLAKAAVAVGMDDRLGPAFVGFFGLISQFVSLWLFRRASIRPADRLSRIALVAAAFSVVLMVVCFGVLVGSVMQGW